MSTALAESSHPSRPPAADADRPLLSRRDWTWTAVLAVGFVALFFDFIWRMFRIAVGAPSAEP